MYVPAISNYAGPNSVRVDLDDVTVWYSYYQPVAFQVLDHSHVVHTNDWFAPTGRHLTAIDGGSKEAKKRRVDHATFARLWKEQTATLQNGRFSHTKG